MCSRPYKRKWNSAQIIQLQRPLGKAYLHRGEDVSNCSCTPETTAQRMWATSGTVGLYLGRPIRRVQKELDLEAGITVDTRNCEQGQCQDHGISLGGCGKKTHRILFPPALQCLGISCHSTSLKPKSRAAGSLGLPRHEQGQEHGDI